MENKFASRVSLPKLRFKLMLHLPALDDPASAAGVGLDDPQRSLPTPKIL